jgi:glycosyltransferase involved in cell wall biosynthesis
MPTVLLEAMARGLPVISTDIVGIPELVDGRETGLLVAPDDPQLLAEAIAKVRKDPAIGFRLGLNGRNLIAAKYDPEATIEQLLSVFENSGSKS